MMPMALQSKQANMHYGLARKFRQFGLSQAHLSTAMAYDLTVSLTFSGILFFTNMLGMSYWDIVSLSHGVYGRIEQVEPSNPAHSYFRW